MKRNIEKMAEEGQKLVFKNSRCCLDSGEINSFFNMYINSESKLDVLYQIITTVFDFGAAVGYRIAKREAKNKASVKKISA